MSEFLGTKGKWDTMWDFSKGWDKRALTIINDQYDTVADVRIFKNEEIEKANALLISKAPEMLEMLKYFTAFPDEDFEEDMDKHISFPMTVDARKIKEAKQLIKEATEF